MIAKWMLPCYASTPQVDYTDDRLLASERRWPWSRIIAMGICLGRLDDAWRGFGCGGQGGGCRGGQEMGCVCSRHNGSSELGSHQGHEPNHADKRNAGPDLEPDCLRLLCFEGRGPAFPRRLGWFRRLRLGWLRLGRLRLGRLGCLGLLAFFAGHFCGHFCGNANQRVSRIFLHFQTNRKESNPASRPAIEASL